MKDKTLAYNEQNQITGWFCRLEECSTHNDYNDILTLHCNYCKYCNRPQILTQASNVTRVTRMGVLMPADDKDLFIKLFAQEKSLVSEMDSVALNARWEELRLIITHAKIRAAAVSDEQRDRKAKLSAEQREWILTGNGNDPNITDAIEVVKKRRASMTKSDKQRLELAKLLGDDNPLVQQMMENISRKNVDAPFISNPKEVQKQSALCSSDHHTDCPGKYMIDRISHSCYCSCHRVKVIPSEESKLKLNLSFLKKS